MVRRGRGEAVGVDYGLRFLGGFAEVAGELHFLVADLGDTGNGAVEVLLHQFADGVELQTDAIDVMDRTPRWTGCRGDYGCGDRGFDEGSSVHGVTHPFYLSASKRRSEYTKK